MWRLRVSALFFPPELLHLMFLPPAAAEPELRRGDDGSLCAQWRPHASPQAVGWQSFPQTVSTEKSQGMNPQTYLFQYNMSKNGV